MSNNNVQPLKYGYTTGAHAASALKGSLIILNNPEQNLKKVNITLPEGQDILLPILNIDSNKKFVSTTVVKSDNDDIDVTKNCKITCHVSIHKVNITQFINKISHKPVYFTYETYHIEIYAGEGLGIIKKKGLGLELDTPAINPVPLKMFKDILIEEFIRPQKISNGKQTLYIVFSIANGAVLAKETANEKVGIIGGLSLIGKTGIVKPVSNQAYIDTVKAEIGVAAANNTKQIVFTIGNNAIQYARHNIDLPAENFIEMGNFVYQSIKLLRSHSFQVVYIVAGLGKLTKIAQGKKNTNNRYGVIDFNTVNSWISSDIMLPREQNEVVSFTTMQALEQFIEINYPEYVSIFYHLIINNANKVLMNWLIENNISNLTMKTMLTDGQSLKSSDQFTLN